jgi:hypothetical protein
MEDHILQVARTDPAIRRRQKHIPILSIIRVDIDEGQLDVFLVSVHARSI